MKYEYVYILQFSDKIKIGYTQNIKQRFAALQTGSGEKILNSYYVYGTRQIEKQMHNIFYNDRTIGEYFTISFDKAVKTLKSITTKSEQKIHPLIEKYNNETFTSSQLLNQLKENTDIQFTDLIKILNTIGYEPIFKNRKTGKIIS